jgi:Ca2+-binding EF-hand superfamily protein
MTSKTGVKKAPFNMDGRSTRAEDPRFFSLRHFPELHQSIKELQGTLPSEIPNSPRKDWKEIPRKRQYKSTRLLEDLKKSSLGEITALSEFRKTLGKERLLHTGQSSIGGSRVSSPRSRAAASVALTPMESTKQKLSKAAVVYDPRSFLDRLHGLVHNNDGFGPMTKAELGQQLSINLNVRLTHSELDALFTELEKDDCGFVDGEDFRRFFMSVGFETRDAIMKNDNLLKRTRKEKIAQMKAEEEEKIKKWEDENTDYFSEIDLQNAMQKIGDKCRRIDSTDTVFGQTCAASFESYMSPYQFKTQIEHSYGVYLTPAEIGALVEKFRAVTAGEFIPDLVVKPYDGLSRKGFHFELKRDSIDSSGASSGTSGGLGEVFKVNVGDIRTWQKSRHIDTKTLYPRQKKSVYAHEYETRRVDGHKFVKALLQIVRNTNEVQIKDSEIRFSNIRYRVLDSKIPKIDCQPKTLGR